MEIANGFLVTGHSSLFDVKRHPKGSELDNGSLGDSLLIDDLLDFSNEEMGAPIDIYHTGGYLAAPLEETESSNSLTGGKSAQVPEALEVNGLGDICVPCDEMAELEWLSNFVEESFSSADATTVFSSGLNASNGEHNLFSGEEQFGTSSPVSVLESTMCSSARTDSFNAEIHVPGRARSKRSRNHGVCFWNTFIISATDTSTSFLDSTSASTITTTSPPLSPNLDTSANEQGGVDPSALRTKRLKGNQSNNARKGQEEAAAEARSCLHCGVQRTPQWRAGPMGPKTLCNACGVRYKSGRLLPEYRPAASPTFMEAIHSNSHRKVLELRRRKEFGCGGGQ